MCIGQFTLIPILFLLVFHQIAAGFNEAQGGYWLTKYPALWDALFNTWMALSAPIALLDRLLLGMGITISTWRDAPRVLLQCAFCGVVWGLVTYVLYWVLGACIRSLKRIRRSAMERAHGGLTNPTA